MSDLTSERIGNLVIEALERTAFVLADLGEEEAPAGFTPTRRATIQFSGFADGTILLSADDGFVRELASSMLGCDADDVDPDVEGHDALNELANIVGGSIIIDLGGKDHEYQYGLPQTITPESRPDPGHGVTGWVESEEGALSVTWIPHESGRAAA